MIKCGNCSKEFEKQTPHTRKVFKSFNTATGLPDWIEEECPGGKGK